MAFPTYPAQTFRSMRAGLRPADQTDYSQPHPFLPTGWNPDPAAPAAGGAAPAMPSVASLSFGEQNRLANAGLYEAGSFGAENAVANGTGRVIEAADLVLPARYAGGPAAPVPMAPNGRPTQAGAASLTFSSLFGGGATLPDGSPDLGAAAAGLQAAQGQYAARKDMQNLERQGMLPSLTDSPEVSANKFGYLNSRLTTVLNGGQPRAPGSSTYGGAPLTGGKSPILSQWDTSFDKTAPIAPTLSPQLSTADAATAYQQRMATSKTPRLVDFAPGVRGLVDAQGNVSRIPNETPPTQQLEVGGRKLVVGPGDKYFDEQGQPVDFSQDNEKPLSVTDWLMMGNKGADYKAYWEEFSKVKKSMMSEPPAATAPAAAASQDEQALAWAKANPSDPRAAKIKQRLESK